MHKEVSSGTSLCIELLIPELNHIKSNLTQLPIYILQISMLLCYKIKAFILTLISFCSILII
jgi:hypothetical protein